jgi:hypothetical protein
MASKRNRNVFQGPESWASLLRNHQRYKSEAAIPHKEILQWRLWSQEWWRRKMWERRWLHVQHVFKYLVSFTFSCNNCKKLRDKNTFYVQTCFLSGRSSKIQNLPVRQIQHLHASGICSETFKSACPTAWVDVFRASVQHTSVTCLSCTQGSSRRNFDFSHILY